MLFHKDILKIEILIFKKLININLNKLSIIINLLNSINFLERLKNFMMIINYLDN